MAQNKNGPVIGLAIFIVLTVVCAVGWYMTWADNQVNAAALQVAGNKEQDLNAAVKAANADIATMKALIGRAEGEEVGTGENAGDTINGNITKLLEDRAGNGTDIPLNLEGAFLATSLEADQMSFTATDRKRQLDDQTGRYDSMVIGKDDEIVSVQQAKEQLEEKLRNQEAKHSEELSQLESQIGDLRAKNSQLESDYADLQVTSSRAIEALNEDIAAKRQAIIDLRKRLRQQQDLTFSTPDGLITSVDHNRELCYVDLGSADGLRTGVTFSVYTQSNSGVGRTNTSEIKGKIEIVDILGPHRAEGRIVSQKDGRPIATDDPIYSPIFQTGQSLEIAVVGRISTDGLDRNQFRRLVNAAGAKIVSEVNDTGDFADGRGDGISELDAKSRITSRTRFLVVADQGDISTEDPELQKLYKKIKDNSKVLRDQALNLGIHEVGLSTFLEHIGYSRKQISWTPNGGTTFPGKLPNGSKSSSVNATVGRRASSAVVSGAYSNRRRPTTSSLGTTSALYRDQ